MIKISFLVDQSPRNTALLYNMFVLVKAKKRENEQCHSVYDRFFGDIA